MVKIYDQTPAFTWSEDIGDILLNDNVDDSVLDIRTQLCGTKLRDTNSEIDAPSLEDIDIKVISRQLFAIPGCLTRPERSCKIPFHLQHQSSLKYSSIFSQMIRCIVCQSNFRFPLQSLHQSFVHSMFINTASPRSGSYRY